VTSAAAPSRPRISKQDDDADDDADDDDWSHGSGGPAFVTMDGNE
jgi:hypothetical protein